MIKTYKYNCRYCGKEFWNRDKRYQCCSHSCASKLVMLTHRKEYKLKCSECGKEFTTNNNTRIKCKNNFCNMNCFVKWKIRTGFYKKIHHPKGHKNFSKEFIEASRQRMLGNKFREGLFHSLKTRKKMSIAHQKEKSPLWLNSNKNIQGYTPLFNKQLKEKVRVRDNFKCQLCEVPELECRTRLHIHHIDFNKENCNLENLVSLCSSCHKKTKVKTQIDYYKKILSGDKKIEGESLLSKKCSSRVNRL